MCNKERHYIYRTHLLGKFPFCVGMDDSIKIFHLCHNDHSSKAAIGLIANLWCDTLISIEDLTAGQEKKKHKEKKGGKTKDPFVWIVFRDQIDQCMVLAVMLQNQRGGKDVLCFMDVKMNDE